jgi:hypothetical protein
MKDPTMTEVKEAANKVLKKKLIDLTVEDVINFLIELERLEK